MRKKWKTDLRKVGLTKGYSLWREGCLKVFNDSVGPGKIIPGRHWGARDFKSKSRYGSPNDGHRVIVPLSPAAKRLVRNHTIECWVNEHDISYAQARYLYRANIRGKFHLIGRIAELVKDTAAHDAIFEFPGVGAGKHRPWLRRWGPVVEDHVDGISWSLFATAVEAATKALLATTYKAEEQGKPITEPAKVGTTQPLPKLTLGQ